MEWLAMGCKVNEEQVQEIQHQTGGSIGQINGLLRLNFLTDPAN